MSRAMEGAPVCAGRNGAHLPGRCFDVLVSNGYTYEYEATICARSVHEARKLWARRGDWKSVNFKVRAALAKAEGRS